MKIHTKEVMVTDNLLQLSASSLVSKIHSQELSSETVVRAFLDRIANVNPAINAVVEQDAELALKQAREADQQIAAGKPLGKLHGLPVTIKDSMLVKGFKCSKGSTVLYGPVAERDATIITRLREQGAIILGLTNVPEFLMAYETDNLVHGCTNNPYDLTRTPGGSSGGEAAILAACGSPVGIGTDAGGSIRLPAHYCGIAGIKPTQHLVPQTAGIPGDQIGLLAQFGTAGPMGRYIEDLELILSVIAGPDGIDPYALPIPLQPTSSVNLADLKIAWYTDNGIVAADDEVSACIKAAADFLTDRVSVMKQDCPETMKSTYEVMWETFMLGADGGRGLQSMQKALNISKPSRAFQEALKLAKTCDGSVEDYRNRLQTAQQFRWDMMRFINNYDVIICPVSSTPARLHGESYANIKEYMYTSAYNLTGWPAVTVCCGLSKQGLPIGVQVIAKPWHDHVALAVAKQLQTHYGVWFPDIVPKEIESGS